jgi:hypothetical protein
MKNRFFSVFAALGLTALLISGCTKLPQAEIDAANAAIAEAEAAGADVYAALSFVALQDSMKAVMLNIEAVGSKFIKNYTKSVDQLAGVTQFAQEVKQEAETRIEELKTEIQETIAEVTTLIKTNRQLILEAPKGKEGTSALTAIKGELDAIETTINEAGSMLGSGEYQHVLDKAKAAREKAVAINEELTQVIAKYKSNTSKRNT